MGDVAIRVEGLGKQYRLGGQQERYSTLRDQIRKWTSVRTLLRRAARSERRPRFWALKDVGFEVKRGEVVGIIGRNGAGKSTLLKVLSRITEPTEGEVDIYGRVGSLLEVGTGFHPELTGRENIYLNGAILGMKRSEIARKFDEIVAFAEVEKFIDTQVKHYSSGMYMRLAFAVAAHLEPEILVIDEVLAVGDAEFQKKCLGKMGEVAKGGRTVLFVSHNIGAIQALCQTVVVLRSGRVAGYGAAGKMISDYLHQSSQGQPGGKRSLGSDLELSCIRASPAAIPSYEQLIITVELLATQCTSIDHLCILIHSLTDTRVGIIDLRSGSGAYRLKTGQTLELETKVASLNLVEGDYKVGLYVGSTASDGNFLDLATFQVMPADCRIEVTPYPAIHRGFIEFRHVQPSVRIA